MNSFVFEDEPLKALIYGMPGAGKTWLAYSAVDDPRLQKVLVLEAFGNPISVRRWKTKPTILTVTNLKDFNAPYDWLMGGQDPEHPFAQEYGLEPPYKTLVIDGLTEIQRFVTRQILGGDTSPGDFVGKLERQGFGQLLGTMLNWAVHFFQLQMNVIITSHEAIKQDGANGPLRRMPLIWGQSGLEICGYAFLVARVTPRLACDKTLLMDREDPVTDSTFTVATFNETMAYYGKDQYALGVRHMTNPTMTKIMDLIEQSRQDPPQP